MADTGTESALQRKLATSADPTGASRGVLRGLRMALPRGADGLFGLALSVIGATQARCNTDDLDGLFDDDRLIMLLDGPEGCAGGATIDRACLAALTQQQTMGKLTGTVPGDRPFTVTDAAMVAPLLDDLFSRAVGLIDQPDDRRCLEGFRFGAHAEELRSLLLVLDAEEYRVFDLTLEFGGGIMQGQMRLVLPQRDAPLAASGSDGLANKSLHMAFGAARTRLTAVISRLQIPLAQFSDLAPGDLLPLTNYRLDRTDLETISGQCVAQGRLGQMNGLRAIRVNETHAPPPVTQTAADMFAEHAALSGPGSALPVSETVIEAEAMDTHSVAEPGSPAPGSLPEEDANPFEGLSPEEAAAEISALAGLPAPHETGSVQEPDRVGAPAE